ncbi:MAG: fibronectin type III domain-containing protein, partial [Acidobacteriota bacterium]|nr:fibronectin type III domain-containing protein [Acidobacteriota bacterium]
MSQHQPLPRWGPWARVVLPCFLSIVAVGIGTCLPVNAQSSTVGQWSSVQTWPYRAIHTQMLPTGKVIFWDSYQNADNPHLWDPTTDSITPATPAGYNIFCTGFSFLSDGRLLVTGGHVSDNAGLSYTSVYNPFTNTWTRLADMNAGRWYPTNTTLANGDALVVSGMVDTTVGMNLLPQVWQTATGSWRNLTNAQLQLPYYPYMFLAPNGKVFNAGPNQTTRYLSTSGSGAWTVVGNNNYGTRNWGSAVMYDDGKVLVVGGIRGDFYGTSDQSPTATAEQIDLNAASPSWQYVAPMTYPRKHHNATLLPDGKVLVTGGSSGDELTGGISSNPALAAELWDPSNNSWTTLASNSIYRGYHATALLLPDGRILSAGGDFASAELFSPPYLFKGARPTITSAATNVGYGQTFFVGTPDATSINKVTWIRLSSVTHTNNMDQRINRLSFSQAPGGLNVTAPSSMNLCPPGYYMLFILNGSGVPSVAKIVRIEILPPAAPSSLLATAASTSQINLSWTDNSNNEDGFRVERCQDEGCTTFSEITTVGPNITSYSNTGLMASTTYRYRVRAFNTGGNSAFSNIVSAATPAPPPPAAPSSLTATVLSSSQISLSWTDNSNNEDSFRIERCQGVGCTTFSEITTVGPNITNYSNTGLTASTTYQYRVRAYNSGGNSNYSITASATTSAASPPTAPSSLTATVASSSQINLSWTDNSNNEDSFRIERCQGVGCTTFSEITTVGPNIISYSNTGLTASTTYGYRVRSYNGGGNSAYSNTASVTTSAPPPVAPSNLTATVASTSQIDLSWTDNSNDETGFRIERCQDVGCTNFTEIATVGPNLVSYSNTGLTAATTYQYRVRAYNSGGNSAYSNTASVTTASSGTGGLLLLTDDFNDNSRDIVKWNLGVVASSLYDPAMPVNETGQRLEIALLSLTSENHYTGYLSANNYDFSAHGSKARVELVQTPIASDSVTAGISIGANPDNRILMYYSNNSLWMYREPGAASARIDYAAIAHRYFRIRYDSATDSFRGDTSPDNLTWTERMSVARGATALTGVKVGVEAGTQTSVVSPGKAIFDNFELASPTTTPTAPSGLSATAGSSTQINLAWTDTSTNEDGFRIERCQGAGCTTFTEIATVGANVVNYSNTVLTAGATYQYRVRAYNSGGDSAYSNTASVTTPAPTAPAAPSSLTATAASSTQINLAWVDNSTDENGFRIERCQDAGCTTFVEVGQVGAGVTSYNNTGLSASTLYRYQVRAFNAGGNSPYSNIAQATTQPPSAPAAPSGLTASAASSTQINLVWVDNSTNEDGFRIERCQGAGCATFTEIATVGANVISYSNTGLTAATTYQYRVRGYNGGGNSAFSNTATATTTAAAPQPPTAPTSLTATAASSAQINLVWVDNSTDEDGFRIESCQGAGCTNFAEITTVGANLTSYSNTGLAASTTYQFRVRSYNGGGNSAYSNTASAATSAPPTGGLVLLTDDFNDNSRDTAKWNLGLVAGSLYDPAIPVNETGQRLEISLLSSTAGNHYSGYVSVGTYDFSVHGSTARVELAQTPAASFEVTAGISIGIDAANRIVMYYSNNSLLMYREPGAASAIIGYDPTVDRYFRIRYDSALDSFRGDTSPDNLTWTERMSVARGTTALTGVKVSLDAGTQTSIASPGKAIFNNFELASPGTAPASPLGLSATAISSTQINLAWTDNSSNEDGFKIERCQGAGCTTFVEIATVGPGITGYNNTGLVASTTYRYQVRAYNAGGNSAYSNISEATTQPPAAPAAPSGLTA